VQTIAPSCGRAGCGVTRLLLVVVVPAALVAMVAAALAIAYRTGMLTSQSQ